jgi:hypothetical protein
MFLFRKYFLAILSDIKCLLSDIALKKFPFQKQKRLKINYRSLTMMSRKIVLNFDAFIPFYNATKQKQKQLNFKSLEKFRLCLIVAFK